MLEVLNILAKRKLAMFLFFVFVLSLTSAAVFLRSPKYEVSAVILLKRNRAELPRTATQSNQLIIEQLTEESLNSEIEILSSVGGHIKSGHSGPGQNRPVS